MTTDFNRMSQEDFRAHEVDRATRALAAIIDDEMFADAAVARWVSSAPARTNRRKMLTAVIALHGAMVTNAQSIRRVRLSPSSVKKWREEITAARRKDSDFDKAYAAAISRVRDRMAKPPNKRTRS